MHGGDIYSYAEILKKTPEHIIDMSASINPLPLPEKISQKVYEKFALLNRYPDTEARKFRKILEELYGIPYSSTICGNGSTELIYLAVASFNPRSVLILEPTFIEYERACKVNMIRNISRVFSLKAEEILDKTFKTLKTSHYDMVFLCNPNNPTGWLIGKDKILWLIKNFKNTLFIIDEAFIDFVPQESVLSEAILMQNTLVLRSLTKFYGMAGLRFGYAAGNIKLIDKIRENQQPWNTNSIAQWIAEEMIRDESFRLKSFEFFKKEKEFFELSMRNLALEYFSSVANFYLLRFSKTYIHKQLIKKGILVRNCSNFYGLNEYFIRVSVKTRKENSIFFEELQKVIGGSE